MSVIFTIEPLGQQKLPMDECFKIRHSRRFRNYCRSDRPGTGRGGLGSPWRLPAWLWGDAEVAVLSPYASRPMPVENGLDRQDGGGVGTGLPAHRLVELSLG